MPKLLFTNTLAKSYLYSPESSLLALAIMKSGPSIEKDKGKGRWDVLRHDIVGIGVPLASHSSTIWSPS